MGYSLEPAPVDHFSGLSLPFFPNPNLPPVPAYGVRDYDRTIADNHHPDGPRDLLLSTAAGAAYRSRRIQWSMRVDHTAYHGKYDTMHLPRSEAAQCRGLLAALTGYIPEYGIRFTGDEPEVDRMPPSDRHLLRMSGQVRPGEDGALARAFLLNIAVRNGTSQTDINKIDEFLDMATNPNASETRQWQLAEDILVRGIRTMVTPSLKQMYLSGRKHHALRPGAPRDPVMFVRKELTRALPTPQDFIGSLATKCLAFWGTGGIATA